MSNPEPTFLVRIAGRGQYGPVSSAQLREMASRGVIGPQDQIQEVGSATWWPANAVQGLFPVPPPLPPSSPSQPACQRQMPNPARPVVIEQTAKKWKAMQLHGVLGTLAGAALSATLAALGVMGIWWYAIPIGIVVGSLAYYSYGRFCAWWYHG